MTSQQVVSPPPAGKYRIDAGVSEIALSAKHLFGLANVRARVAIESGELVVTEDAHASSVSVTASAASFDSGDARRDGAVKAPKFLDVDRHPQIKFSSTSTTSADGQWAVAGVLTAHGVEAPLVLKVTDLQADASGVTIHATGEVDRYQHGITAMKGMAGRVIGLKIIAHAVPTNS